MSNNVYYCAVNSGQKINFLPIAIGMKCSPLSRFVWNEPLDQETTEHNPLDYTIIFIVVRRVENYMFCVSKQKKPHRNNTMWLPNYPSASLWTHENFYGLLKGSTFNIPIAIGRKNGSEHSLPSKYHNRLLVIYKDTSNHFEFYSLSLHSYRYKKYLAQLGQGPTFNKL
jgi:hypothetical protein